MAGFFKFVDLNFGVFITPLLFFFVRQLLFSGFLQFESNQKNDFKYRGSVPLTGRYKVICLFSYLLKCHHQNQGFHQKVMGLDLRQWLKIRWEKISR